MDFSHLRSFVAVVEEFSFRRAAERLHLNQPPLSRQIKTLEKEIGVRLLERDRGRLSHEHTLMLCLVRTAH
jgi:DNA-binding transcriptional LysR family regulator